MDKKQIIEDYLQGRHPIEQNSWEVPSTQELDNAEIEFDRLMEAKNKPTRRLRLWPLTAAACVVGFVAIFLVPPRVANVEPVEQPVVAQQVDKQEEPVVKEEPAETITEVAVPKKTRRAPKRKPVVQQEPIEESLLAEAEPIMEEVEPECYPTESNPYLLAATQMQDIRSRGERFFREVAQIMNDEEYK